MQQLFAMAVPVRQGKDAEWHQFMKELDNRMGEFKTNRQKLGVRERTFYQQTPQGGLVIVTLEGEDPQNALERFMQGTDEFSQWFLKNIQQLHDIDLTSKQPLPKAELILDSGAVKQKAEPVL